MRVAAFWERIDALCAHVQPVAAAGCSCQCPTAAAAADANSCTGRVTSPQRSSATPQVLPDVPSLMAAAAAVRVPHGTIVPPAPHASSPARVDTRGRLQRDRRVGAVLLPGVLGHISGTKRACAALEGSVAEQSPGKRGRTRHSGGDTAYASASQASSMLPMADTQPAPCFSASTCRASLATTQCHSARSVDLGSPARVSPASPLPRAPSAAPAPEPAAMPACVASGDDVADAELQPEPVAAHSEPEVSSEEVLATLESLKDVPTASLDYSAHAQHNSPPPPVAVRQALLPSASGAEATTQVVGTPPPLDPALATDLGPVGVESRAPASLEPAALPAPRHDVTDVDVADVGGATTPTSQPSVVNAAGTSGQRTACRSTVKSPPSSPAQLSDQQSRHPDRGTEPPRSTAPAAAARSDKRDHTPPTAVDKGKGAARPASPAGSTCSAPATPSSHRAREKRARARRRVGPGLFGACSLAFVPHGGHACASRTKYAMLVDVARTNGKASSPMGRSREQVADSLHTCDLTWV